MQTTGIFIITSRPKTKHYTTRLFILLAAVQPYGDHTTEDRLAIRPHLKQRREEMRGDMILYTRITDLRRNR